MGGAMVQRTVKFRQRGATGNGIRSVSRTYAISAQGTTVNDTAAPAIYGTWSAASPAVTEAYPYLWAKEIVVYTDDTSTTRYYCIGARGANGVDAQDIEWVYIRTKTNVAPVISGDGGSSPYTDHNGKTYTSDDHLPKVTAGSGGSLNDIEDGNSGNTSKKYECTDDPKGVDSTWKYEWEIKREKGAADANGHRAWQAYSGTMTLHNRMPVSIASANVWYALSDSGTTAPADSVFDDAQTGFDDFPPLNSGKYIWQATKITDSNGAKSYTGKMCLGPTTDFLEGTEVYATDASNTTPPANSSFGTTYTKEKGKYLWTATRVKYANQTNYTYLNKKCVGYWGEDGKSGTKFQRMYKSTGSGTYTGNLPAAYSDNSNGWYKTPTAVSSSARYRWVTERSSDDGGTTWTDWSTPQIETYLAADGTSINITGTAVGIISGSQSAGDVDPSPTNGDIVLDNTSYPSGNLYTYSGSSWTASSVAKGTGYICSADGHLYMASDNNAAGKKWIDCGQIKGDKGDPAEYYALTSPSIVTFNRNFANVASPITSTLVLTLTYSIGGTQEKLTSIPSGMTLKTSTNGMSWTTPSSQSLTRNVSTDFGSGNSVNERVYYGLFKGTALVDSDYTDVYYEIQRMLIPQGQWDDYNNYQFARTNTTTPLVYLGGNNGGTYWYLAADTNNIGTSSSPQWVTPGTNESIWVQATNYEVILAKMLFAEFARLGSYIVYDRFFFSQYGTLVYKGSNGNTLETVVNASNVARNYNSITPIVLEGNETNDIIVCNVAFYATANTQIKITLTPSSEANYDFGAIGVLGSEASPGNSRWLESASQSTIKNTGEGTYMLKKASGVTPVNTTITIPSTGEYYIEIAYACDVDVDNDDTATFVFEKTTGTVTWRSVTKVAGSQWMTFKGKAGSFVPYAWFDPEDPMAENVPATGYKFRPTKCINALTGEEWMAGGNMHVNQNGDVTMQNAVIEGSLMYHKTLVDKADNFIRPFTMWNAGGTAVDIDGSATVERVTLQLDTIIIAGSIRTGTYNLFTGIVVTGYTVILPPAKFFLGMRIKIVNGTFIGGNGNAAVLSPSPINLAVIYRSDTEELVDNIDNSYDANMIAAALPVTFNYSAGDFTFIGAPDSTKHQDYTPSTADRFTCYGLKGSSDVVYKSIELAALLNPYVSGEHYCWMIIDARQ